MKENDTLELKQYVSFYIGDELFGIDIKLVNEVNPNINIIPIPLTKPHIRGHVNIRGQVVLVLDPIVMFGKKRTAIKAEAHIIILKTIQDFLRLQSIDPDIDINVFGSKPVAILIDDIGDVIRTSSDQIETPTKYINTTLSGFVDGMVKTDNHFMIIINPVKLLNYKYKKLTNESGVIYENETVNNQ